MLRWKEYALETAITDSVGLRHPLLDMGNNTDDKPGS